jgi:signal transduction histidine kinase
VTFRRALLLAFVLLGLLPCMAVSWLSFERTRQAMEAQIAQSLTVQAGTLQAEIDRMLFERFQNALVWSRSELMQDLRLGDVDKRVSGYLVGLAQGYGEVYRSLECLSGDGLVLASSRASTIGTHATEPPQASESIHVALNGGTVRLMVPAATALDDGEPLAIETLVYSAYAASATQPPAIARFRLAFDARQISLLLDGAAIGRRQVVVIDKLGRWIAGSHGLRGATVAGTNAATLTDNDAGSRRRTLAWDTAGAGAGALVRRDMPWQPDAVIAGIGHSRAAGSWVGSGWTTVVFEPVDEALAPVHDMAAIFAGLLLTVLLAIVVAAPWLAAAVARPIAALVATTRRYQFEGRIEAHTPAPSRIVEIDELDCAYRDMIKALEQSRQELMRTAKQAMLGELAGVLAHEVRTPLGIMRSSAQVLLRDRTLGADGRELMGFIESETERLNRLVTTLLDTARPRRPEFSRCDLHELLARCVQMQAVQDDMAAGSRACTIELQLHAKDPLIEADAEQLMQATFNLLHNAVQAVGPNGRIRLSTSDDGAGVRVSCADDGPGIAADIAERIFDPFFTRREGGVGLGLAVVRQVIGSHNGHIRVQRSAWGGTEFVFTLPRLQDRITPGESCP